MPDLAMRAAAPQTVVTMLERVPAWAAALELDVIAAEPERVIESVAHLVDDDARAVVLVDAALLDPSERAWLDDVRAGLGPVIAIGRSTDELAAARRSGVDGALPQSFLDVPADLAREVLGDHVDAPAPQPDAMERFMRDAIHEFRTPLTVIAEFTALCEEGLGGPLTDKQRDYLAHVQAAAERLCTEFDDYRDTIRLETGSLVLERNDASLEVVIASALDAVDFDVHRAQRVDDRVTLDGVDAARLTESLQRVLRVGEKFRRADEPLDLTTTSTPTHEEISIGFVGILPSEDDMHVLDRGYVDCPGGPYRTVARVFGLGAAMAHKFLERSGGSLRIERRGTGGGALVVSVPVAREVAPVEIAA